MTLCDVQSQLCDHQRLGVPADARFYDDDSYESDEDASLSSDAARPSAADDTELCSATSLDVGGAMSSAARVLEGSSLSPVFAAEFL